MCDHAHYRDLANRVSSLEKTDIRHDEKIRNLERSAKFQMITVWGAFFLTLLALIYGALGPRGFNAVTTAAPKVSPPNSHF